jgi:hypothetical protein
MIAGQLGRILQHPIDPSGKRDMAMVLMDIASFPLCYARPLRPAVIKPDHLPDFVAAGAVVTRCRTENTDCHRRLPRALLERSVACLANSARPQRSTNRLQSPWRG